MNETRKEWSVVGLLGIIGVALFGAASIWFWCGAGGKIASAPESERPDESFAPSGTLQTNRAGVDGVQNKPEVRGSIPRPEWTIEARAIRDGDVLLADATPEIRMAYKSLLRFGLSAESSKCALRPILMELLRCTASEQRILHAEKVAEADRERVQSEDLHQGEEKDVVLRSIASVLQSERARWIAKHEEATNQLMMQIAALGVVDTRGLFEDLMLIRPDRPLPPAPPPSP